MSSVSECNCTYLSENFLEIYIFEEENHHAIDFVIWLINFDKIDIGKSVDIDERRSL